MAYLIHQFSNISYEDIGYYALQGLIFFLTPYIVFTYMTNMDDED